MEEAKKPKGESKEALKANKQAVINSRPPEVFTGKKEIPIPSKAAGLKAVGVAVKHMLKEMPALRANTALLKLNQKDGYDCPGCAWPDPDDHRSSLGEYCENGAKAMAEEATTKIVDEEFFRKNSVNELALLSDYDIGKKGRITRPFYLSEGASHYEPISWEDSFKLISEKLNGLDSPNEAVFYTSGRTSNEAAFLYQLFVRNFGTNNLPDCSNMCHESSGVALGETIGIGKGTVTLDDFENTELILVVGQNPGTNHPRMLKALAKAKRNGSTIISINPLPEAGLMKFQDPQRALDLINGGEALTDLFLQVKINEDMALFKAFNKYLLEQSESGRDCIDKDFISERTLNYESFLKAYETQEMGELIKRSGVDASLVKQAADLIASKSKIIICWAMGITQQKTGVENIQEMVNTLLLKGSIGREGAGACPVRGHSNVQGDRTMGIYEKPPEAFLASLDSRYSFKAPRDHGYDVVYSIKAMSESKVKAFIAMGGNFLSATPDTDLTAEGLSNCDLTVQVSTKLNRSHLVHGKEALILPCLGRSDQDIVEGKTQFVSVENSMGVVHKSTGKLKPISNELLSEPAIIAGIAEACFPESDIPWAKMAKNYDLIRDEIEACIPGFNSYNERVRKDAGFYLPNSAKDGSFKNIGGKAKFSTVSLPENDVKADELILMSVRTHDQFNTTIYGLDDRYRGILNERRLVFMNKADMKERRLVQDDVVDMINEEFGKKRIARKFIVKEYSIPKGNIASYFPETNVLVPIERVANRSNTPTSKFVPVKLVKA